MLKDFIDKEVIMYVGFSNSTYQGGAVPAQLRGRILEVTDSFVKIDVNDSTLVADSKAFNASFRTGRCVVNIRYVISVFEK